MKLIYKLPLVFICGIVNELIQVAWVHYTQAGVAFCAALVTLVMCTANLLGISSLVDAVNKHDYKLFMKVAGSWATGSAVGTYIGVLIAKH